MKPKHILILSILAGLLAVLLVQVQLKSERGDAIVLFRATETVLPGQALGRRVEEVTLPGDKLFPNLLKEAPTADMRDYVTSTALRETVHAGQVVLYRHLETTADPGLRIQIPPGKKAIAVEVDAAAAVAYLVEPEDRVDVLAALPEAVHTTSAPPDLSRLRHRFTQETGLDGALLEDLMAPIQATELRTQVLLEDVTVLAVGRRYRRAEPGEIGARYDTVTLLVSEEQAKKVAHARDVFDSPMTLVLRGTSDAGTSDAAAGVGEQG